MGKTGCWTFEKGYIWLEGLLRQEGQEEVAFLAGDLCANSLGMKLHLKMKIPVWLSPKYVTVKTHLVDLGNLKVSCKR